MFHKLRLLIALPFVLLLASTALRQAQDTAASGHMAGMAGPPSSTIASTTTVATSTAPGWTRYVSINHIHDLAFAPDGTLWARSNSGLVHWDLSTDTYTRYLIQVTNMAVAPDGTLWLATDHGVCHFDGTTCRT